MSSTRTIQTDNATVEIEKSPVEQLVDELVETATLLAGDTLDKEERTQVTERFEIAEEGLQDAIGKRDAV